jgi:hypothetical protein
MPDRSSDQVIQQAREVRLKQIQECSSRAARKILAQLSKSVRGASLFPQRCVPLNSLFAICRLSLPKTQVPIPCHRCLPLHT